MFKFDLKYNKLTYHTYDTKFRQECHGCGKAFANIFIRYSDGFTIYRCGKCESKKFGYPINNILDHYDDVINILSWLTKDEMPKSVLKIIYKHKKGVDNYVERTAFEIFDDFKK